MRPLRTVISASRRTDLVAFFPTWLAAALRSRQAVLVGPRGRAVEVDLSPETVHTLVLWSKDFTNLLRNESGLRDLAAAYDQVYCHFTVTGLGGTSIEPGAPPAAAALAEVRALVAFAGDPRRVTLRFDPVV
ncbi:MAG TPA: DUF1848 family protein, partial [Acidobacteriota bacterium]|nr:DUF1848 family protein [Acidobacteriota bacterium]